MSADSKIDIVVDFKKSAMSASLTIYDPSNIKFKIAYAKRVVGRNTCIYSC